MENLNERDLPPGGTDEDMKDDAAARWLREAEEKLKNKKEAA